MKLAESKAENDSLQQSLDDLQKANYALNDKLKKYQIKNLNLQQKNVN